MPYTPTACRSLAVAAFILLAAGVLPAGSFAAEEKAPATQNHSEHSAAPAAESGGELSEASKAFEAAMQKMHKQMTIPYSNDVDVDFVRGMIPHHQGAIDQAEVLLKYSKNPRLRRLAGGIIAAQRREIRFMENWLKEHASGKETGEMPEWLKNNPATSEDAKASGAKD